MKFYDRTELLNVSALISSAGCYSVNDSLTRAKILIDAVDDLMTEQRKTERPKPPRPPPTSSPSFGEPR